MRLATYRVPRAGTDTEDAEATVTRAGGTTDANIARWIEQFDERGKVTRTERDVRGLKITIVDVSGTYLGSGMGQVATAARPGWGLLGAIVESARASYFVKVTGPAATVRAAREPLNLLLGGVTPI